MLNYDELYLVKQKYIFTSLKNIPLLFLSTMARTSKIEDRTAPKQSTFDPYLPATLTSSDGSSLLERVASRVLRRRGSVPAEELIAESKTAK